MKAIILAGGEGTRLKAVTGDTPKPMVPLLGRPLMEYTIRLLRQHGFTEICAAVRYRAEEIMARFGDGHELGVSLSYRAETEAWGTAGAVRRCRDFIGAENVLIISGDAACDFDLGSLYRQHRERQAAATLALCRVSEPLRFGLTVTDTEGWIRAFIEKPDWRHVVTDLVNTGIYVLSPRALDAIPADRPYDFAKDLFPALLREGQALFGAALKGYWRDIGTPLSYYQCCVDALEPAFRPAEAPAETAEAEEGFTLDCPCRNRAEVMGALSEGLMDLRPDYSDGLRLAIVGVAGLTALTILVLIVDSIRTSIKRRKRRKKKRSASHVKK